METINKKYYLPLLKNFYENTKDLFIKSNYPYGPFIPYVFSNYYKAPLKIFYCGIETAGWIKKNNTNNYLLCGREGRLQDYLEEDAKTMDVDKALEVGNRSGNFWPFVNKLHLLIRTKIFVDDLKAINSEQKTLLSEIGYGNINAMEKPDTITHNEGNILQDLVAYWKIREMTHPFESLKSIINAYSPNIIIVLGKSYSQITYNDLDLDHIDSLHEEGKLDVYKVKSINTIIFQTLHPHAFSFKGTNNKEMAYIIYNALKEAINF